MGQETADGSVQTSEKCNSGSSTTHLKTVIQVPETLPDSSNSRSAETKNRPSCSGRGCATGNDETKSWVIDVMCKEGDEERVCRICHLDVEQPPVKLVSSKVKSDLIQLGCGCRGELSVAHFYCAEAWFKLKGNRICEICGQTVNNVRGVGSESFLEEWKDGGLNGGEPAGLSESSGGEGCWQSQPLCNFIMACLVIAFVLPWFFRINLW